LFPDVRKGTQQGLDDIPIIRMCHENKWLLLTQDKEMLKTHLEEIKRNPHVTVLATTSNCATPEEYREWLAAVIKLKPKILRLYKKEQRPWFATFSKEGNITNLTTITEKLSTRRTRRK
jgi:predicted nuclease of predicted toxin-antitoxin system